MFLEGLGEVVVKCLAGLGGYVGSFFGKLSGCVCDTVVC